MKSGLLIIDMLNEYLLPEGKIYCKNCVSIIPTIAEVKKFCATHKIPVFYVNTALTADSVLVKKWGEHAIEGTKMAEVITGLEPTSEDLLVPKQGYNGFFETDLADQLKELGIEQVVVTGIHTHVCVLMTAVGAFERGFDVVTLDDCITTGYQPNHDTRLRFFASHIGKLISSHEWMNSVR